MRGRGQGHSPNTEKRKQNEGPEPDYKARETVKEPEILKNSFFSAEWSQDFL